MLMDDISGNVGKLAGNMFRYSTGS